MQTQTASASVTPISLMEQFIAGERRIYVGPSILVASRTTPGVWYICEDGRCSCPGFTYHGHCHHVAAAKTAAELDRQAAKPVQIAAAPTPVCSVCGGVWTVKIAGVAYCGQHAPLRPTPKTEEERMARAMDYDRESQKRYGIARNN